MISAIRRKLNNNQNVSLSADGSAVFSSGYSGASKSPSIVSPVLQSAAQTPRIGTKTVCIEATSFATVPLNDTNNFAAQTAIQQTPTPASTDLDKIPTVQVEAMFENLIVNVGNYSSDKIGNLRSLPITTKITMLRSLSDYQALSSKHSVEFFVKNFVAQKYDLKTLNAFRLSMAYSSTAFIDDFFDNGGFGLLKEVLLRIRFKRANAIKSNSHAKIAKYNEQELEVAKALRFICLKESLIDRYVSEFDANVFLVDTAFESTNYACSRIGLEILLSLATTSSQSELARALFVAPVTAVIKHEHPLNRLVKFMERNWSQTTHYASKEELCLLSLSMRLINSIVVLSGGTVDRIQLRNSLVTIGLSDAFFAKLATIDEPVLSEAISLFVEHRQADLECISSELKGSAHESFDDFYFLQDRIKSAYEASPTHQKKVYLSLFQNLFIAQNVDPRQINLLEKLSGFIQMHSTDADHSISYESMQSILSSIRESFKFINFEAEIKEKTHKLMQAQEALDLQAAQLKNAHLMLKATKDCVGKFVESAQMTFRIEAQKRSQLKTALFNAVKSSNGQFCTEILPKFKQSLDKILHKASQQVSIGRVKAPQETLALSVQTAVTSSATTEPLPCGAPQAKILPSLKLGGAKTPQSSAQELPPPPAQKGILPTLKLGKSNSDRASPAKPPTIFDLSILPKPKIKTKCVHWAIIDERLLPNTFWSGLNHRSLLSYVNFDLLAESYRAHASRKFSDGGSDARKNIELLDPKKAHMLSIVLSSVVGSMSSLIANIRLFQIDALSESLITQLISCCPQESDEVYRIKAILENSPASISSFPRAEQFILRLYEIPHVTERLNAIRIVLCFDEVFNDIYVKAKSLFEASEALIANRALKNILCFTLIVGNFLNLSKADPKPFSGIKIASFKSIACTKSFDATKDLLDFIAECIKRMKDGAGGAQFDDLQQIRALLHEAAKYDCKDIELQMQRVKRDAAFCEKLGAELAAEEPSLASRIRGIEQKLRKDLAALDDHKAKSEAAFDGCKKFFVETTEMTPGDFFGIFANLFTIFERIENRTNAAPKEAANVDVCTELLRNLNRSTVFTLASDDTMPQFGTLNCAEPKALLLDSQQENFKNKMLLENTHNDVSKWNSAAIGNSACSTPTPDIRAFNAAVSRSACSSPPASQPAASKLSPSTSPSPCTSSKFSTLNSDAPVSMSAAVRRSLGARFNSSSSNGNGMRANSQ